MRDYMRVHDVGHDMVSFTVLLRGTKQELEEAGINPGKYRKTTYRKMHKA